MKRELATDIAILDRLLTPAGRDVLDVGCGQGALVRELSARGARAIGVEVSDAQLAAARERDRDHPARYVVGLAQSLPIADASVDVVVFMRALHHVAADEMTGALTEARRVLRRGGAVYVAEPLPEGSFFELMLLVEDERPVWRAAEQAIERAGDSGLRRTTTVEYAVQGRYAGVGAFRALMVGVDPTRGRIFDERDREIALAFARLGEPGETAAERCFCQPMRADVLQPEAP